MRIDHAHSLGSALAYKPTIYRRSVTVRPPVASALVERQLRRGDRNAHIGVCPLSSRLCLDRGHKGFMPSVAPPPRVVHGSRRSMVRIQFLKQVP